MYFSQEELISAYNFIVHACEGEREEGHNMEADEQEEMVEQVCSNAQLTEGGEGEERLQVGALIKKKTSIQMRKLIAVNCS